MTKAEERAAKREAHQAVEDIRAVMNLDAGRRLMYRILTRAHLYDGTHCFGPDGTADTVLSMHAEGERNSGLLLLEDLKAAAPTNLIRMLNEGLEQEHEDESRAMQARDDAAAKGRQEEDDG